MRYTRIEMPASQLGRCWILLQSWFIQVNPERRKLLLYHEKTWKRLHIPEIVTSYDRIHNGWTTPFDEAWGNVVVKIPMVDAKMTQFCHGSPLDEQYNKCNPEQAEYGKEIFLSDVEQIACLMTTELPPPTKGFWGVNFLKQLTGNYCEFKKGALVYSFLNNIYTPAVFIQVI